MCELGWQAVNLLFSALPLPHVLEVSCLCVSCHNTHGQNGDLVVQCWMGLIPGGADPAI